MTMLVVVVCFDDSSACVPVWQGQLRRYVGASPFVVALSCGSTHYTETVIES